MVLSHSSRLGKVGSDMALFDNAVDRYEAFCQTPQGRFVNDVEKILLEDLMHPRAEEMWIDLGCGTGSYSMVLASHGCVVVGVDESQPMLERARLQRPEAAQITYIQGDIGNLPYGAGTYDGALLQVALEFVSDPRRVICEALRVLKPRGRLVMGVIQGSGAWAKSYRARARQESSSVYGHAHFWTLPELVNLMGRFPSDLRAGLFVGPEELVSVDEGWKLEKERRQWYFLDRAGFLAVRYDRMNFGPASSCI